MTTPTRSTAELRRLARRRTVVRRPLRQPDGAAAADSSATLVDDGPAVEGGASAAVDTVPAGTVPASASAGMVPAPTPADTVPADRGRGTRAVGRTGGRSRAGLGPRRGPGLLVVGLLVLLVAAIAAAGWGGYGWYQQQQLDAAHQQALAAARQTTVNFVSVSAKTVDRDLQRVVAGATGDFKDEFTRGESQVRSAVVENNVDSRGSVLRAALVSGDTDSAVVLVAVDATVKNVKVPQGRLSHYRIQVTMAKDAKSGRWLVSKLQFVG